jgi:hypothetical protein
MMRRLGAVLGAVGLLAAPAAAAQDGGITAPCMRPEVPTQAREACLSVAQAVESAQPQLGILIAGGNPTPGAASAGGLRLGVLPRVSASGKLNLVMLRLPDILAERTGTAVQRLNQAVGIPAPALAGTATIGVFPGLSVAPTVGGIGAIDLVGTGTWLPLPTFGIGGFADETSPISYGIGARLGILRESFLLPGASVSVVRHRLGQVAYGEVCPGAEAALTDRREDYALTYGLCPGGGDPGEFGFDLTNWSTRAVVSKRLLGFGAAAGIGYDRYSSDIEFGFRAPPGSIPGQENYFVRASELGLSTSRLSYFANGSFTLLVATLAVEAGWTAGGAPVPGFTVERGAFDPRRGTWFGSLGARIAL